MKITRKAFLKAGALIGGGIFLQGNHILNRLQEKTGRFKKLRDNVGVYTERGGTIGWLADENIVVVIDSQFPDTAKNFYLSLQEITPRKIDRLFNTHYHSDHTSGNNYLKAFVEKIVAHKNCAEQQKNNYGNDPSKPQTYPDTIFSDQWTEKINNEKISAKYFGPAHTGGDSVIYFENANIAHIGDLVFNKTYPYIDLKGGGSIRNWVVVLDQITKYYLKDTTYIFGHGITDDHVVGSKNDLTAMRDYLSSLIDFVSKEIKNGKTKEQIVSVAAILGFNDLREKSPGIKKMNLEKMYEELTATIK
jgi:cyclase